MRERTDIIGRLVSAANSEQQLCQSDIQALLIEAAIELRTLRERLRARGWASEASELVRIPDPGSGYRKHQSAVHR